MKFLTELKGPCLLRRRNDMNRMSNAPANKFARLEPTHVRFSVRTLLIVTVPVALIAFSAGRIIRVYDQDQQARIVAAWIGWFALVAVWMLAAVIRRIRVEKSAGRTITRLSIYGVNPYWRLANRCLVSGYLVFSGMAFLSLIAASAADAASLGGALLRAIYPSAIGMAWLTAMSIAVWWWGRDVRLTDAGVLWDKRMIRWSEIHERWDPDRDAVTLSGPDQYGIELKCDVVVPEKQRIEIEALLTEKSQTAPTRAIH